MNKFVLLGLAIIAAALGLIFMTNRGSQIRIVGEIKKVRSQKLDDHSTMLVFDFRFSNPANYPFIVADVTSICTDKDGKEIPGEVVTDDDARRIFDYYSLTLGPKYNESLIRKSRVAPRTTEDRMIALTYPVDPSILNSRTGCILRIRDVDGATSEIKETLAKP